MESVNFATGSNPRQGDDPWQRLPIPLAQTAGSSAMPARLVVEPGTRFGRLVIVSEAEPEPRTPHRGHHRRFNLRCDCGGAKTTRLNDLRSGVVNSCGCLVRENNAELGRASATHGDAARAKRAPEYRSWHSMIQRCENPNSQGYKYWGGRGISVCERWRNSYATFLADVGRRPSPQHSIDRYPNGDGNYEPGNVRWADKSEQAYNRRKKGTA